MLVSERDAFAKTDYKKPKRFYTLVSSALLAFRKRKPAKLKRFKHTPSTYTTPEFVPNPRAITCRYKSYRQIKFWHDSLSGINSRIPGKRGDTVTRTCVSFSRSLFFSLPPSLSRRRVRSRYKVAGCLSFSLSGTWHDYLSFYTPD